MSTLVAKQKKKPSKGIKQAVAFYSVLSWGSTIHRKAIEQLVLNINLQSDNTRALLALIRGRPT